MLEAGEQVGAGLDAAHVLEAHDGKPVGGGPVTGRRRPDVPTAAPGFPRELGYRVSSNGTALVGRNPKNKLKLGQEIKVVIDKVFVSDKQLDFRLG